MSNLKNNFPRLFKVVTILAAIIFTTGCGGNRVGRNAASDNLPSSINNGREFPGTREPRPGGLDTGELAGIGIGAALGAALLGYLINEAVSEDNKNPTDPTWEANGPVIPAVFNFSDLKIGGYVQGGWPIAVDYQLSRPGAATLFVKTANSEKPLSYQLDGINTSRQLKILKLPESLGDAPVRAIVGIHATESANGINKLLPIRIFGIACGTKAVGSIGIDHIEFGPDRIKANMGELAHHSFFAHKSFNKVYEEFRKIEKKGSNPDDLTLIGRIVNKNILDPFTAINESTGQMIGKSDPDFMWDGRTEQKLISKGIHQLQIRAWYKDDKDWVTAFSPGFVSVSE